MFSGALGDEIARDLELPEARKGLFRSIPYEFASFDRFLVEKDHPAKDLPEGVISEWLASLDTKASTKKSNCLYWPDL